MILVQEEKQEPIGGEVGKDSTIMIIPQENPTSGEVGMTLNRTSMSFQVGNDSYQMSVKW